MRKKLDQKRKEEEKRGPVTKERLKQDLSSYLQQRKDRLDLPNRFTTSNQRDLEDYQKMEAITQQALDLVDQYWIPDNEEFVFIARNFTFMIHSGGLEHTQRSIDRRFSPENSSLLTAFSEHLTTLLSLGEARPADHTGVWDAEKLTNWNWNHHYKIDEKFLLGSLDSLKDHFFKMHFSMRVPVDYGMPEDHLETIRVFMSDPSSPMPEWIPLNKPNCNQYCINCGKNSQLETNGHEVRLVGPCEYPEGYPPWSVEVEFPTGKIYVWDDLRPWFPEAEAKLEKLESDKDVLWDYSVNRTVGNHNSMLVYAEENYLTGPCGNSCPGIYQKDDNPDELLVATPAYEDEDGNDLGDSGIPGYTRIGGVCTNLWRYSFADAHYMENSVSVDLEELEKLDVIHVNAGRWRCTNYQHLEVFDLKKMSLYAKLERLPDE